MKKNSVSGALLTWVCIGLLAVTLGCILLKYITLNVLVERLHVNNAFTEAILDLNAETIETLSQGITVDWEALYPHDGENTIIESPSTPIDRYRERIQGAETDISSYATEMLPFYRDAVNLAAEFERAIGWNFVPYSEYNGVCVLENGYLAVFSPDQDVTDSADATVELAEFCARQGADFLYVEYPCKISKYDDPDISGYSDFSNQRADAFLARMGEAGIPYLDIRENIHEAGLVHRDLFYNTDHHWKAETGLWASGLILQELHDRFGMDTHSEVLDAGNFTMEVYPDWFLGSQGKKVTLAQATPEDFTLIYPKAETLFHYVIPSLGIDTVGDFSVTYDMSQMEPKDYYGKNPYGAYNHADQPLIQIENERVADNGRVLIIHTSFSNCVIPFLAMDIKQVDALDLRHFTGSVRSYIEQTQPDVVIVASTCGQEGAVNDWVTHTNIWDFS